jgi:hypothetical protein
MQVLSIGRLQDCISVEIGYEESLAAIMSAMSTESSKALQQAMQLLQSLMPTLMPTTKRVTKATLCLSEEEYEVLGKPTVGDEVELDVSNEGVVTIRFVKH